MIVICPDKRWLDFFFLQKKMVFLCDAFFPAVSSIDQLETWGYFISNQRCDFGEGQEIWCWKMDVLTFIFKQNASKFLQTFNCPPFCHRFSRAKPWIGNIARQLHQLQWFQSKGCPPQKRMDWEFCEIRGECDLPFSTAICLGILVETCQVSQSLQVST